MGVWVLMLFTFDYARLGKPEDAAYHGRWNFGIPFYTVAFLLNGAAGIYLVSSIRHEGGLNEIEVHPGTCGLCIAHIHHVARPRGAVNFPRATPFAKVVQLTALLDCTSQS